MPTDINKRLNSLAQVYGFSGGGGNFSKTNQGQNSQISWLGADNWQVKLGDGRSQKGKGFASLHQYMSANQQPVLPGSGPPGGEPGPVKAHYDFEEMLGYIMDGWSVGAVIDDLLDDDCLAEAEDHDDDKEQEKEDRQYEKDQKEYQRKLKKDRAETGRRLQTRR